MNTKLIPLSIALTTLLVAGGCSQTTYKASTYKRTVTTQIEIVTDVPSEVWVSNQSMGITPLTFPFSYEEEVDRQEGTANYWETNPGTAGALTVLSFGLYLPFSFIPAEPTSESRPAGKYIDSKVTLRLEAEGYEPLEHTVECKGEPKIDLNFSLNPTGK